MRELGLGREELGREDKELLGDDLLDEGEDAEDDLVAPEGAASPGAGVGEPGAGPLALAVPPESAGLRLDKALALAFPALSRSRLKALMDQGRVAVDGRTLADASYRVKAGQSLRVEVPEPEPARPEPEDIPLRVVFEDEDLLVIDKPAGLVVHPAAGNPRGTLVNALLHHCGDRLSGVGGVRRPGIVHRLDKDTSGLMVVAKNDRAHAGLSAQFADRSLSRTYLAVVHGLPHPKEGRIEGNIGRSSQDRKRMAVVPAGAGKTAVTLYRVARGFGAAAALVECTLLTGRTHQIRVHMSHVGHALVGDPVYGGRAGRARSVGRALAGTALMGAAGPGRTGAAAEAARAALSSFPRQALHAARIRFVHPRTGNPMAFESEPPHDMLTLLGTLESL